MDTQKMNAALGNVEMELGNALLSTDVWKITDGEPIAGYNSQPMACALFNQITDYVNEALEQGQHPKLEKYYILSLEGDKMVLIMPLGEYIWEMFIDTKKTRLGVLLNVTIPQMLETFEKIIST